MPKHTLVPLPQVLKNCMCLRHTDASVADVDTMCDAAAGTNLAVVGNQAHTTLAQSTGSGE
jgi:hypothetical protein